MDILKEVFPELFTTHTQNQLMPTGVDYFDHLSGGGLLKDSFVAIIGPSGHGKTTIMCQVWASYIESNERALFISTEQAFMGDIASRTQTLMTGQSKKEFLKGNLSESLKNKLRSKAAHWEQFGIFESWVNKEELAFLNELEKLILSKRPEIVLLDGWQRVADLIVKDSQNPKLDLRENLQGLKNLAIRHQVPIIVSHQLSGVAASKRNVKSISHFDAQEDKDFVHRFDMSIFFARTNSEGITTMVTGKSRHSAPAQAEVRLRGEFCKFEFVEDPDLSDESLDVNCMDDWS